MKFRARAQRRAFDRQLRRLAQFGDESQRQQAQAIQRDRDLADIVYIVTLERFVDQGGVVLEMDEESQVPILDRLLEFFQWLWESGALIEIIRLIIGGMTVDQLSALRYQPRGRRDEVTA